MKVFVWSYVEKCTDNYHSGGGVVVFADTEERAREIANEIEGCNILDDENPKDVRDVDGGIEAVYIMQDAGCC
jgi:hypothetical protein